MTCENCHEGQLVPTQVSRLSQGLGRTGNIVALGGVLLLGAFAGLGLAVVLEGGVDLSWALVATPAILVACTPFVLFGAIRAFSEKRVWYCEHCDHTVDRA